MIEERQAELDAIHRAVFGGARPPDRTRHSNGHARDDDSHVVERACAAANGEKLRALLAGDRSGYPSASEADLAAASLLAWFSDDPAQIERIMRASALAREKWDRHRTYLGDTIARAVADQRADRPATHPRRSHLRARSAADDGEERHRLERSAIQGEWDPDRRLRLSPRLTRAEMARDEIRFLCPKARFLARGLKQDITSLGGVGKTRLMLQMFFELSRGDAVFGCEFMRPERPMKCLYIGAEDRQPFFNYLARPLLMHDADTLPFDVILLPETWPGFSLTPTTAGILAEFLSAYEQEHGLDIVGLDPMLSVIGREYADMIANPVVARAFFNDCIAPLIASQTFALLGANHDSKGGAAVTGSADQQNVSRCVLQLTVGKPRPDGTAVITAGRHKDNLGFRFSKLALERDPETLLLRWDENASVYAYDAPPQCGGGKVPHDPAGVRRYLAQKVASLLMPTLAADAKRGKRAVGDWLRTQASRDGISGAKQKVLSFLERDCAFEERKDGRVTRKVLVGVRNPDAQFDGRDEFLAGRSARE